MTDKNGIAQHDVGSWKGVAV